MRLVYQDRKVVPVNGRERCHEGIREGWCGVQMFPVPKPRHLNAILDAIEMHLNNVGRLDTSVTSFNMDAGYGHRGRIYRQGQLGWRVVCCEPELVIGKSRRQKPFNVWYYVEYNHYYEPRDQK
jgi:hypothetical protein